MQRRRSVRGLVASREELNRDCRLHTLTLESCAGGASEMEAGSGTRRPPSAAQQGESTSPSALRVPALRAGGGEGAAQ